MVLFRYSLVMDLCSVHRIPIAWLNCVRNGNKIDLTHAPRIWPVVHQRPAVWRPIPQPRVACTVLMETQGQLLHPLVDDDGNTYVCTRCPHVSSAAVTLHYTILTSLNIFREPFTQFVHFAICFSISDSIFDFC